jgi:hypothetical protein
MASSTSPKVFYNIEEAISREVRRITFQNTITKDFTILRDTYDPFTGEVIVAPIEPKFYDSSADASHIQSPNFFIKLLKTREDRFTGRVLPEYGKWLTAPIHTSPAAYVIIVNGADGVINPAGNDLSTSIYQIRRVQVGYYLRLLGGNNKGTYVVQSITVNSNGNHTITVSNVIGQNLPAFLFDTNSRTVLFQSAVDLNTVQVGDIFTDSLSNTYNITAVNPNAGSIVIDGGTTPSLLVNSTITRTGNVFKNTDLSPINYIVMDPAQPIQVAGFFGTDKTTMLTEGLSPQIPIDVYYLIRIDSKTRENHISVLNRVWEEFNPPRTALPVIQRSSLSAEQLLTADITSGGSNLVQVGDVTNFSVGDQVYLIDQFHPTKLKDGTGFERPFQSTVTGVNLTLNQLTLADTVPDTFIMANSALIVSNCNFHLLMFHFVDHATKDVEGSQYWVHEFTFWVQGWVDRLEEPSTITSVTSMSVTVDEI